MARNIGLVNPTGTVTEHRPAEILEPEPAKLAA